VIRRTPEATDWSRGAFRHEWRRRIYVSFILVGTSCAGSERLIEPDVVDRVPMLRGDAVLGA
jgi:hypothetical protein